MTMKNQERAVATLVGEVHALFMFCQVLAKAHPDPQKLLVEIDDIHNRGSAVLGPSPVPEATVEGFDFAIQALRKIASEQAAKKQ